MLCGSATAVYCHQQVMLSQMAHNWRGLFISNDVCFLHSFLPHPPSTITFLTGRNPCEGTKQRTSYMFHKVILWCMVRQITSALKWETVLEYSGHTLTHVIPLVLFSANFFCQILFVTHHCCLRFVSFSTHGVYSYMYFLSVSVALLNIL